MSSQQYDCHEGYSAWGNDWSVGKMRWCCAREPGLCQPGAKQHGATTTTPFPRYDCEAQPGGWREVWSARQKSWCCRTTGIGCDPATTTDTTYTTLTNTATATTITPTYVSSTAMATATSITVTTATSSFTVTITDTATRTHTTSTQTMSDEAYDCEDASDPMEAWPAGKRAFCCQLYGLGPGCPGEDQDQEASPIYDCEADFASWRDDWSGPKREWCCANRRKGCRTETTSTASLPFDCGGGLPEHEVWPEAMRRWCCTHADLGCEGPTAVVDRFDCSDGFFRWRQAWTPEKQEWCCANEGRGCPDEDELQQDGQAPLKAPRKEPADPAPHKAPAGAATQPGLAAARSLRRGAPRGADGATFDCSEGYEERMRWPEDKRKWCCRREGLACPKAPRA